VSQPFRQDQGYHLFLIFQNPNRYMKSFFNSLLDKDLQGLAMRPSFLINRALQAPNSKRIMLDQPIHDSGEPRKQSGRARCGESWILRECPQSSSIHRRRKALGRVGLLNRLTDVHTPCRSSGPGCLTQERHLCKLRAFRYFATRKAPSSA
jgi:hypothetical protein